MSRAVSFAVGLVFAIGLGISGMTQPEKVIGFLDVFGKWDPSLMFVMAGAVGVYALFWQMVRKRQAPLFAERFRLPSKSDIDGRLVLGSVLFGLGWGFVGFCPGPALVSLASLEPQVFLFVGAMLAGMILFSLYDARSNKGE